jgi:uncharacterized membrane protein
MSPWSGGSPPLSSWRRTVPPESTDRFHAFQGLYLFVAWLIVDQVIRPVFHSLPAAASPCISSPGGLDVYLDLHALKASHQTYSLPIIGDLAQKSATGDNPGLV